MSGRSGDGSRRSETNWTSELPVIGTSVRLDEGRGFESSDRSMMSRAKRGPLVACPNGTLGVNTSGSSPFVRSTTSISLWAVSLLEREGPLGTLDGVAGRR